METENNKVTLHINSDVALPNKGQWKNRFEIKSSSSDRIYVVSQNLKGYWGCSCFQWIRFRKCKHLTALNLPNGEVPYEPNIIRDSND